MRRNVLLGLGALIALAVLSGLAMLRLAPVDPVPPGPGTAVPQRLYDYGALRSEASATPSRVTAEATGSETLDDGGLAVTVSLTIAGANPLDLPPVLRDGVGAVYEVESVSWETARRALPELVEGGEAAIVLVFLDVPTPTDETTPPVEPLTLILNPGSSHELAPEVAVSVPLPEPTPEATEDAP
jgi:hypothetical protein